MRVYVYAPDITVTGAGEYSSGTSVTITAVLTTAQANKFSGWFKDGVRVTNENVLTYTFTAGSVDVHMYAWVLKVLDTGGSLEQALQSVVDIANDMLYDRVPVLEQMYAFIYDRHLLSGDDELIESMSPNEYSIGVSDGIDETYLNLSQISTGGRIELSTKNLALYGDFIYLKNRDSNHPAIMIDDEQGIWFMDRVYSSFSLRSLPDRVGRSIYMEVSDDKWVLRQEYLQKDTFTVKGVTYYGFRFLQTSFPSLFEEYKNTTIKVTRDSGVLYLEPGVEYKDIHGDTEFVTQMHYEIDNNGYHVFLPLNPDYIDSSYYKSYTLKGAGVNSIGNSTSTYTLNDLESQEVWTGPDDEYDTYECIAFEQFPSENYNAKRSYYNERSIRLKITVSMDAPGTVKYARGWKRSYESDGWYIISQGETVYITLPISENSAKFTFNYGGNNKWWMFRIESEGWGSYQSGYGGALYDMQDNLPGIGSYIENFQLDLLGDMIIEVSE